MASSTSAGSSCLAAGTTGATMTVYGNRVIPQNEIPSDVRVGGFGGGGMVGMRGPMSMFNDTGLNTTYCSAWIGDGIPTGNAPVL